jgi:hypothetical protein
MERLTFIGCDDNHDRALYPAGGIQRGKSGHSRFPVLLTAAMYAAGQK